MNRSIYRVTVLTLTGFIFVSTPQPCAGWGEKPAASPAERAIKAVLNEQAMAWNRRDLESYMNGYWRSPKLTFFSGGTSTSGWEATLDRYRQRYQGEGREMGHLEFSELEVDLLAPGAALMKGRWHLRFSNGEAGGLFTLIFKKFKQGWKIVHDHTGSN